MRTCGRSSRSASPRCTRPAIWPNGGSLAGGNGSFEAVERLDQLSIDAELALATPPAQRAEALKKGVDAAKTLEAMTQKRLQAGLATTLETLEAKAHRLSLEIKLGEESANEGKH